MIDVFLVVVIVCLLALIGFIEHQNRKERAKLVNALMSRTSEQFRDLELTDKIPAPKTEIVEPSRELSESELDDKTFMKLIEEERN